MLAKPDQTGLNRLSNIALIFFGQSLRETGGRWNVSAQGAVLDMFNTITSLAGFSLEETHRRNESDEW